MQKICNKCKENKPLEEYYKEVRHKDGRYSECKSCVINRQEEYNKSDRGKATQAEYRKSDRGKAVQIKYNNSDKGRAAHARYMKTAKE